MHVVFLISTVPTMLIVIIRYPMEYMIKFIINIFLVQSWFPKEDIWLSYNSVSWFLSTLTFLFLFIKPLHKFCKKIEERCSDVQCVKIYLIILIILFLIDLIIAMVIGNISDNVSYYLYAFPPMRLIDYCAGFFTGRLYSIHGCLKINISNRKYISAKEIFAVGVMVFYLLIYPVVPKEFSRAVLYLPGAVFVIFIIAEGKGIVSKVLSIPMMVAIGNGSLYYMMCHQVILRYCSLGQRVLFKCSVESYDWIWVFVGFILTFASKPVYDKVKSRLDSIKLRMIGINK